MRSISGKDFAKVLERMAGHYCACKVATTFMGKPEVRFGFHGNQALKVGLLRHLMKMAGLTENAL